MADFTLSSGSILRPFRSPWGAFPVRHMPISSGISSATIHLGRIVGLDVTTSTNGNQIVPSSQTAGVVVSTAIVGVAAESPNAAGSTTTRGTEIPVWEANPNVEFRAHTQGALLAAANIGTGYALVWDSTLNIHKVDLGNSTAAVLRAVVTELIDAIGDSGGAVAFRFMVKDGLASSTNQGYNLAFYR